MALRQTWSEARSEAQEWATFLCMLVYGGFMWGIEKGIDYSPFGGDAAALTASIDQKLATNTTVANNISHLIIGAVGLGVTVILLLLMILISGEFADAIPSSGEFTDASNDTIDHGGTSYGLMAVALLIVPIGAVLGVLFGYLSGWFNFGLGNNGGRR